MRRTSRPFLMWAAEPHLEERKKYRFPRHGLPRAVRRSGLSDQAQGLGERRALSDPQLSDRKGAPRAPFSLPRCPAKLGGTGTPTDENHPRRARRLVVAIRTIPDYPKPGILFRDITTLLGDARAFRRAIDELVHPYAGPKVRPGGRHRGAGLHPRRRYRAPAVRRLHPDPQEGQAAARDGTGRPTAWNTASTRWRCTRTR